MIDSYSFGKMVIAGKEYIKDLIILPSGNVFHPWWRKSGHKLDMSDLKVLIDAAPEIIVVGNGSPGLMIPEPNLISKFGTLGTQMIVLPTEQAVREYNTLLQSEKTIGACFHLTC